MSDRTGKKCASISAALHAPPLQAGSTLQQVSVRRSEVAARLFAPCWTSISSALTREAMWCAPTLLRSFAHACL